MKKKYLTNTLSREIVIFYPEYIGVSVLNNNIRNLLIQYGYNLKNYGIYDNYEFFRKMVLSYTYKDIYNDILNQLELLAFNKKVCFTSIPYYVNYIHRYFINFNVFFENSGAVVLIDTCYKNCPPLTIKYLNLIVDELLYNVVFDVYIRITNNSNEIDFMSNDDKWEILKTSCAVLEDEFHYRYSQSTKNKGKNLCKYF